jgi:hypothetical protein
MAQVRFALADPDVFDAPRLRGGIETSVINRGDGSA